MYWLAQQSDRLRTAFAQRFDPSYWTVNFARPMMAAVTTQGADRLTVDAVFYRKSDLAGLIWSSEDTLDPPPFRYETRRDYRGVSLMFRWQSSNVMALDAVNGPTLTIEGRDALGNARTWYVRLWNYATGTATDAAVSIDFAALDGGFLLPAEADPVYAGDIDRMFISIVSEHYAAGDDGCITDAGGAALRIDARVTMSDIVTDGDTGLALGVGFVKPHALRIANGYDDTFNLTPQRLVENFLRLGYRDLINHYVGMSHFFTLAWNAGEERYVVDAAAVLNAAAHAWHADFLARARVYAFDVILSVSFEILAEHIPADWRQLAYDGSPSLTGWDPPSSLISPANAAGLAYLRSVFTEFAGLAAAADLAVCMQLGEPWWWIDPAAGAPCIYDAAAMALYMTQTGHAVPARHASILETPTVAQQDYIDWLGGQLGVATLGLRDAVKSAFPGAQVTVLIYTPQILGLGSDMPAALNLPTAWSRPAFDFVQLEDYDNIIAADWARHAGDMAQMAARLRYAPQETQYFSGFILNAGDRGLWRPIDLAVQDAAARGFAQCFVWAYSQVARDGLIYFENGEDEVSGFHEVRFPAGISYGARGRPRFSTQVVEAASGFEQRNANWAQSRASYNAGSGMTSEAALGELIAFFRARQGRAYGFRFKDWSDYSSAVLGDAVCAVDQTIGVGDGSATAFQLVKTYSSGGQAHVRPIVKPVAGTVRVAVDAVELDGGWSVDTVTGVVTFDAPPGAGDSVQAGFEFDVPVRFDADGLDISLETFRAGAMPDIAIVEIRLA